MERKLTRDRNYRFLQTDIHKACSNDDLRPAMQCVYFKDGYAYATDAHIAVRECLKAIHDFTPDEIKLLDGKKILGNSFTGMLNSCSSFEIKEDGIDIVRKSKGDKLKILWAYPDEKYPDLEGILKTELERIETDGLKTNFNLDVGILSRLLSCIKIDHNKCYNAAIRFNSTSPNRAVMVTFLNRMPHERLGLIMPKMS